MGRVLTDRRTTNGVTKDFSYSYNFDSTPASLTYANNRVITYAYNAAERALSAVEMANSINYALNASYTPHGALSSLTNGASIVSTFYYNTRLQPASLTVTKVSPWASVMNFTYTFANASGQNNGNVLSLWDNVQVLNYGFQYDELNRLARAEATNSNLWGNTYVYDIWGNLYQKNQIAGTQQGEYFQQTMNSKNQFVGWSYDAAGNLLNDGAHSYAYDPDGRIQTVDGTAAAYLYSPDGRRAQRTVAGVTTLYAHDAGGGAVLTETRYNGPGSGTWQKDYIYLNGALLATESATDGTRFHFSDHLGTPRVVTDAAGSVISRHDYYPYGREITPWTDGESHKFTGKERDSESGLDNFGARYYSSAFGRYLSPDWSETPQPVPYADFGNPQTLNLYQYVGNNPITTFDADGHCWPPSACADALDSFVQTFRQDGLAANDRTSSPTLAAINTLANGVVGDLASGAADVLRLGNGTAAAIDSAKQGDYLGAAANLAQDGGRAATVILAVTAIGARANAPTGETLQPGPNAEGSIPASGPRITAAEQRAINQQGQTSGCHTCGTTNPGTKSGNFVGDHQPPTALANGRPQSLSPQCLNCSRVQGGQVRAAQQAGRQIPPRQPPPPIVRQKKPEEN